MFAKANTTYLAGPGLFYALRTTIVTQFLFLHILLLQEMKEQINMNYNQISGCPVRTPGIMPQQTSRFPVGMGYVPWQAWETPYPMEQGFRRGTIFPSLDYPFMMGGCRR